MYRSFFMPFLIFLAFVMAPASIFAATDPIVDFCATSVAQADQQARQECEDLEALQNTNTKIKGEKDSIQNDIKAIEVEIKIALQKIKVQERIITQLSKDINIKSKDVANLQGKIDIEVKSIASLIQKVNERDSVSLPEILLNNRQFSDFYTEIDAFYTLNKQLTSLINDIKSVKVETETAKQTLEDRKDRESDAKEAIESQKRLIDRKKVEKNSLLAVKTTEYSAAQKLLSDQKAKVAQIRSRLFKFQDGEGIPFGDAYDFAIKASKITGVRPAFVLGILMQESSYDPSDTSFGKNVGKCFVRDMQTGAGVGANTGSPVSRVMNPTRDIPVFLNLTASLGRDPLNTRVSCWIVDYVADGSPTGWGGAMGPAQFIPSTWDNGKSSSIKNRTSNALGIDSADPWKPEHAITASSIFLADLGAGLQTFSAEKNAACQYYSGKKCSVSSRANTYGTNVMKWVTKVQEEMINPILGQ